MSTRTIFLSRLIGLYSILASLAMVSRTQATVAAVTTLVSNPSAMLVLGVIALTAGLAMVLAHNVWSGGALPVVVTIAGWATLAKGLLFLLLPPQAWVAVFDALRYRSMFPLFAGISIVIGLYLTYGGFKSESGSKFEAAGGLTQGTPHAA